MIRTALLTAVGIAGLGQVDQFHDLALADARIIADRAGHCLARIAQQGQEADMSL